MIVRRALVPFACLMLAALPLAPQQPAAPAAFPAPAAPVPPARTSRYLSAQSLNFTVLVARPPAPGSVADKADLEAVRQAEATRTPAEVKAAQRDDREESLFAFATVLGPGLNAAELPLTAALSTHLRAESGVVNPGLKLAFKRPRPFVADAGLHPVCARTASNSYPSGHAMVGYLEAFALTQMVPEQADAILARGEDYAHNRIVCGVHYPTDLAASHQLALALFGELEGSATFQAELAAARVELRHRLQLAPLAR